MFGSVTKLVTPRITKLVIPPLGCRKIEIAGITTGRILAAQFSQVPGCDKFLNGDDGVWGMDTSAAGNLLVTRESAAGLLVEMKIDGRGDCLGTVPDVGICDDLAEPSLAPTVELRPGGESLGEFDAMEDDRTVEVWTIGASRNLTDCLRGA